VHIALILCHIVEDVAILIFGKHGLVDYGKSFPKFLGGSHDALAKVINYQTATLILGGNR